MTTYNEIAGRRVNFLSSDPSYVDTNSDGQVWYNENLQSTFNYWIMLDHLGSRANQNIGALVRLDSADKSENQTIFIESELNPCLS